MCVRKFQIQFLMQLWLLWQKWLTSSHEDMDSSYTDQPVYSAVRWLSCEKNCLQQFVTVWCFHCLIGRKGTKLFRNGGQEVDCETWIFADHAGHLNKPNLTGAGQTLDLWTDMITATFCHIQHSRGRERDPPSTTSAGWASCRWVWPWVWVHNTI